MAEDDSVHVGLAASHVDSADGCLELSFAIAGARGGTIDGLADIACAEGTVLAGDIDEQAEVIPVLTTAGFPASGHVRIGDEVIAYSSATDTQFIASARGAAGTSATSHLEGADVSLATGQTAALEGNITDVDSVIVLAGVDLGFEAPGALQIGAEIIAFASAAEVKGPPGTTEITGLARGAFGTLPAAHVDGDLAYRIPSASTLLAAAVDDGQTSIPVVSAAALASPDGSVQVGGETIAYTGIGTDAETCGEVLFPCLTGATRGAAGSQATAHADGAAVIQLTAPDTDLATAAFTPDADYFAPSAELTAAVTADATVLPATSVPALPLSFPASGSLAIGDEVVSYAAIGLTPEECLLAPAPCFTGVARGEEGTEAAAHPEGARVYQAYFMYTAAHNPSSAPRVVGVEITAVNDRPAASDVSESVVSGAFRTVVVTGTDIDGDSGAYMNGDCELGFTIHTFPAHGVLGAINNSACVSQPPNIDATPNEDSASVTYTPDPGYTGDDSFVVRVCDDDACALSSVALSVLEPTPSPAPSPTPEPTPTPPPTYDRADLDCDGDIDAVDALVILRAVAGLDSQPAGDAGDCPPLGAGTPTPEVTAEPTPEPTEGPTEAPPETPAPTPTPTATPPPE